MVASLNVVEDFGFAKGRDKVFRYEEIVDAPSGVRRTCAETVAPPGVFNFLRMQASEGIDKARLKKAVEEPSFFRQKARVLFIRLRILQIDRTVSDIDVSTDDDIAAFVF